MNPWTESAMSARGGRGLMVESSFTAARDIEGRDGVHLLSAPLPIVRQGPRAGSIRVDVAWFSQLTHRRKDARMQLYERGHTSKGDDRERSRSGRGVCGPYPEARWVREGATVRDVASARSTTRHRLSAHVASLCSTVAEGGSIEALGLRRNPSAAKQHSPLVAVDRPTCVGEGKL